MDDGHIAKSKETFNCTTHNNKSNGKWIDKGLFYIIFIHIRYTTCVWPKRWMMMDDGGICNNKPNR